MERVKIDFPEGRVVFSHIVSVRIGDVNHIEHLGHDALLRLLHEARAQWFVASGHHESNTQECACIVVDLAVSYRSEARFPQSLKVEIAPGEVERFGCELFYQVTQRETGKLVALARTGHVFFHGRTPKLVPVPEAFRTMVAQ